MTTAIHPTAHTADKAILTLPPPPETPTSTSPDASAPEFRTPNIIIGAQSLIHPFSTIASLTPAHHVVLGERCVVWEKAVVGGLDPAKASAGRAYGDEHVVTELADDVVVHPHATVHAGARIGRHSVIGIRASVGAGAVLGEGVTVTSGGSVGAGQDVSDGAVIGPEGKVIWSRRSKGEMEGDVVRLEEMRREGREKERVLGVLLVKGRAGGSLGKV